MPTAIDTRFLTDAPDPAAVKAWRVAHRGDPSLATGGAVIGPIVMTVVGLMFAVVGTAFGLPQGLLPIGLGAVVAIVGIVLLATGGRRWTKLYRLWSFAAANRLVYYATGDGPGYPGAIFNRGHGQRITDHLVRATGRTLDYGNYTYTTGSGKNQTTHSWWFLALRLDRALPHMVLDSRANNALFGATNLPVTFAKDQTLRLEGDFNEHFTLYAPKEYERDALYVFTPDLMALCIDEASAWDLEIVDDWLFAYSSRHLDMADPAVQQRIWRFIDTVGAKTLSQTDQYADERAGGRAAFAANVVAPEGARLKRGVPWIAIVTTVVIVGGYFALRFFGVFR
ncbi:MAG: hypothetical protein J7480_05465 [Microbacteriaceae bacterium]|nr:hypothetical protein [Microbacteriaceae bacterium]